ncbi:MAG: YciI family protein [Gammaproteobacteria bacterium]|nr:hypothetical protein [Gammaproteobacteria bacterium]
MSLYAVLIYDSEAEINSLSKERMDELIARHETVQARLAAENKLGPVVRLMPTDSARTLRQGTETFITDGPFAETKEQLLGFYMVDCPTPEEAMEAARMIGGACGASTLEVRPVQLYYPAPAKRMSESAA